MPKKLPTRGKHRASWSGILKFGLVSFPVEAFNALIREQGTIALHQLHSTCHSRIHYEKHCPIHGQVSQDEIVSGYEYGKDKYIEIDPEELDALHSNAERALTIDAFVAPEEIDPLYYDGRVYYLAPKGQDAAESYAVFQEAMQRQGRYGVGQVIFSGREQLVLLRAVDELLAMIMLNYDAELRKPADLPAVKSKVASKKVQLAENLIEAWGDSSFDFAQYKDHYHQKLAALIEAKIAGKKVVVPEVEDEPEVINLMDALRRSVAAAGGKQRAAAAPAKKRKRAAARQRA
jgi:DNA end-binding protein Ku